MLGKIFRNLLIWKARLYFPFCNHSYVFVLVNFSFNLSIKECLSFSPVFVIWCLFMCLSVHILKLIWLMIEPIKLPTCLILWIKHTFSPHSLFTHSTSIHSCLVHRFAASEGRFHESFQSTGCAKLILACLFICTW